MYLTMASKRDLKKEINAIAATLVGEYLLTSEFVPGVGTVFAFADERNLEDCFCDLSRNWRRYWFGWKRYFHPQA